MRFSNIATLVFLTFFLPQTGTAGGGTTPVYVTSSDTGIMFGDLDCKITDSEIDPVVRYSEDSFNNLFATVTAEFACVDRSGIPHRYSRTESVWFPTLTFDWQRQEWMINGKTVASRNPPYGVLLNPELDARVWQYLDETHLAFKIELWDECGAHCSR